MPFLEKLLQKIDRVDTQRLESILKYLADERDFLEKIFNLLFEGIVVVSGKGSVAFANKAARNMISMPEESIPGLSLCDAIEDPALRRLIGEAISRGRGIFAEEVVLSKPSPRRISVDMVPMEDADGRYDGAVVMLRDTTGERVKHDRLARLKKMGAFSILAAGIAHEVGNPLNSLGIHLQLLERKISRLEDAKKNELLDLISITKEEVARLEHIIRQFMKAAHPAAPERKEEDIIAILERTLGFLEHEISRGGVRVRREFGAPVPPLLLNADQIRQVFINLIRNALQAMPGGGLLDVRVGCERGHVVVSFTDTGCGIPEDDMEKIFEPYFTTRDKGAGLGLMIVQRVINEHGGDCLVSSQPGKGTTVTVKIPIPQKYRKLIPAVRRAKRHLKAVPR